MKGFESRGPARRAVAIGAFTLVLSACAAKQEAPVAAPPPQVAIPPRPRPPLGAQTNLNVPPADAIGNRRTINVGISPAQTLWNLRSAYNVAALNCMGPSHTGILENYKTFLKGNAKTLTATNKQVDKEFRTNGGKSWIRTREAYMTQVYNFYALPPTLPAFCDAALAVSNDMATVPSKDLSTFATTALPRLDRVFLDFYNSYDQYRADLANWQQRYAPGELPAGVGAALAGAPPPAVIGPVPGTPGPVAGTSGAGTNSTAN